MLYCTCGHFLVESESRRKLTGCSLYPALRDQEGATSWCSTLQTEEQNQSLQPSTRGRDVAKELTVKKNIIKEFTIVFKETQVYRDSQLKIGWTEEKCIAMDILAQEDHSYRLSKDEFKRYQGQWYFTLKKSGKNAPMRLRSDLRAAVTIKNKGGTLLPQAIPRGTGTRPKAGGAHEFSSFFKCLLQ